MPEAKHTLRSPVVTAIYRYPVKGMTPEPLEHAELAPGQTIAYDRAWAIEKIPGRFDPAAPAHLPKIVFVMLMRDERLATIEARFDEASRMLRLSRGGTVVGEGCLETERGRTAIEAAIARELADGLDSPPRILCARGHSFSDVRDKCLHIVNLASLRELERIAGRALSPLRFRPNVLIDGLPAWSERSWVDKRVIIGTVAFDVFAETVRCPATNVDPATGVRDAGADDVPRLLSGALGHKSFGIYARVAGPGRIAPGDAVVPPVGTA